jgi:hypothetical protein
MLNPQTLFVKISKMKKLSSLICVGCLLASVAFAQSPVAVTVDTRSPGLAIPPDFIGLSFGPSALQKRVFDSTNTQLLTLFRELGIKYFRMGGTMVDTNKSNYMPSTRDIDALFGFVKAAGLKDVIYTLRLENGDPAQDAATARYIWTNYRQCLTCFAIGNEPNLYKGGDPEITNYASYLAKWRRFEAEIAAAVPDAKFGGPDVTGKSRWVADFADDEAKSGVVTWILAHWYVGGKPKGMTAQDMIDGMLSPEWVASKYPAFYNATAAKAFSHGFSFRLTEANDYTAGAGHGGIPGGNNGFATALFALDFMHWWAEHGCQGVSVHTGLSNLNGAVYRDGRGNWQVFPFSYGIKAFDLGSHGRVEPVTMGNADGLNLTAYAVGDEANLYVTIINKEHGAGVRSAGVTILPNGFVSGKAEAMFLTAPNGNLEATNGITLGGASITNNAPWHGQWTVLKPVANNQCTLVVPAAAAAVVKISLRQ